MNGNDQIAMILKSEGVEWLACYPSNPLIESCAQVGIRPIAFRHERGAVMAADGFSRVNDRGAFGVVAVQSQAGAENALGGVAQAFGDNTPILVLPGGVLLNQIAVSPNYSAVKNYGGVTKSLEAIYRPADINSAMRRAFSALRNGSGGPVVVELMTDVCAADVSDDAAGGYRSPAVSRSQPESASITAAARHLLEASRPVIWAGGGVLFSGATNELAELSRLAAAPVFTTMQGKSAFNERHPMSLGAGGMTTTGQAHQFLTSCDVLMALGSSLTRTPYGQRVPRDATLIQNTEDPTALNKDENVDLALLGDTKLTLVALVEEVARQLDGDVRDSARVEAEIAEIRAAWMAEWEPLLSSDAQPLNTYRVIREIDENLDNDNSIVTHDAGAPRDSIVPFYTATTPHSYVGWGKTTHLGAGIPLMIGAKMAHPDRFCLNLMGDGAFGMSGTDVETSARSGAAITTVLLNNGGMATYPPAGFPTAREQYGVSHMLGDYAKIAEGMGATGITVTTPAELADALSSAQQLNSEGKAVLIDAHSDMEGKRSRF